MVDASQSESDLRLSFDPMTIEHLGFKMYSRLPNAAAELVANSYDADATRVEVLVDTTGTQSVQITDDGHGMSPEDLAERYLRIGRNRRADDHGFSESGRRRVAGRKGLGKLALFGIGKRITVRTKRTGSGSWTVVTMDWDDLRNTSGRDYFPETVYEPTDDISSHGTMILVEELKRTTRVEVHDLAESLSQLFNYMDVGFKLTVAAIDGEPIAVEPSLRYASIEEESRWSIPDDIEAVPGAPAVRGVVIAAKRPLRQSLRGLTIYVKGRLANDPEFFGVPESSYAFSYITGYIEADYLDDRDEDVVATDRRSIDWDSDEATTLRDYLAAVLREVARLRRETRRTAKKAALRDELDIDVDRWTGTIEDSTTAASVRDVLDVATSPDTELSDGDRQALVTGLKGIAPEYADLHWRSLHPSVQAVAQDLYKDGHYFHALLEAIKRYAKDVQEAGKVTNAVDLNALQFAFSKTNLKVDVAQPYLPDQVTSETAENLREAQRVLSEGLWRGFRSPIAHEDVGDLKDHDVFSYQDCLDALSILSHLRRRIERVTTQPDSET